LAFAILDGSVADVLRGGVAKDIARRCCRGDIANPAADNNSQFGLKICPMIGKGHFNLCAVRDKGSSGLQPEQRFLRQRFVVFSSVVGVIQAHGDDFGRRYGYERADALEFHGLFVKRRRAKDVTMQSENFTVNCFGVKHFVALLESAYCCHKCRIIVTKGAGQSQG
jgi:hypothetical protein